MNNVKLYFATNRGHEGGEQWQPRGYGGGFSKNGHHNLRFGYVKIEFDESKVKKCLTAKAHGQTGDGEELATYFTEQSEGAKIIAFEDEPNIKMEAKDKASTRAFRKIKTKMEKTNDVVVFIHGYNVKWNQAVGSALSLQFMLNRNSIETNDSKDVIVILFSWPSDGSMLPYAAYWSDRADAKASGQSIGRGLLTLSSFLQKIKENAADARDELCEQNMHLLCHSMGNFALQHALLKMIEESPGMKLPRIFRHIFLCAPDVDDNVLEPGQPMDRLHELSLNVSVYFNSGDVALRIADVTKGHHDRLGQTGMARESQVHRKVHEVDCSEIVQGAIEHSYFLWATVNDDIRQSIDSIAFGSELRKRDKELRNSWLLK